MTIVIPLGKGSSWQDGELLFALRSYEKYVPHDRVMIVGERPSWIQNVTHISMVDLPGRRAWNIARKVLRACQELKEPFMFSNDDIFCLQGFSILPNYYDGKMKDKRNLSSGYYRKLEKTLKALRPDALFYDVHTPMMISPVLFQQVIKAYDYEHNEYIMKSIYGNNVTYPIEEIKDCKIRRGMTYHEIAETVTDKPFFSVDDGGLNPPMKKFLNEMYPDKSKYEL